ncbi:MAG: hypothetical protein IJH38_07235, partial [Clostridia bacterium]|nr:hypothetical protein [Clostridia bacterium]
MKHTSPLKLTAARAWRTYTGGSEIDRIHGIENGEDGQFPEEWIMSTVTARNPGREDIEEGICYLQDEGISLKAYIEAYPEEALGKAHIDKIGRTTGVLVKIIDAAERLTVQCHPNKEQALKLFHSQFGKTECWYILGGREIDGEKPSLYFGFQPGIDRQKWQDAFDRQDIPAMLGMMHHFEVQPGDTFLIKGGVPHAIGAGCLLVEIQEPTDYTIRIERVTPKGLRINDLQCHQGLGFERMFDCFDYTGHTQAEAFRAWKIPPKVLDAVRRMGYSPDTSMTEHVTRWWQWYTGEVGWYDREEVVDGRRFRIRRHSLRPARRVCREWASAILDDDATALVVADAGEDPSALQSMLDAWASETRFLPSAQRCLERAFATGTGALA